MVLAAGSEDKDQTTLPNQHQYINSSETEISAMINQPVTTEGDKLQPLEGERKQILDEITKDANLCITDQENKR
jgi:hypothetical protein